MNKSHSVVSRGVRIYGVLLLLDVGGLTSNQPSDLIMSNDKAVHSHPPRISLVTGVRLGMRVDSCMNMQWSSKTRQQT